MAEDVKSRTTYRDATATNHGKAQAVFVSKVSLLLYTYASCKQINNRLTKDKFS